MGTIAVCWPGTGIDLMLRHPPARRIVRKHNTVEDALRDGDFRMFQGSVMLVPWYPGFEQDAFDTGQKIQFYYPAQYCYDDFLDDYEKQPGVTPEQVEWMEDNIALILDDLREMTNPIVQHVVMDCGDTVSDYWRW